MANTQTRSFVCSLFAIIAALFVSNIALADLVTYWTFNDYANGTLISATDDSSGNGYKFGLTNPNDSYNLRVNSSTPGVYGNHLQRNSYNKDHDNKSNSNISAANVYSGNMTISFWGTQPSVNWRNYITLRTEASGDELQFQKANNGMVVYKTDSNNKNAVNMVGDSSLSLGTAWHHFVVTVDSSTQKAYMYIDGALISETTWTHNLQVTNITLNGMWNKSGRSSDAKLDELQIYNNSITAEQVQFLYQNPSLYLATAYQRNVTANGNWSDADWNANGQTGQTFANSSAVQLDATNSPALTADQNVTVNSIDFNGSMTVDGSNTITLNGEKRITVANAADTAAISAPITAQYDNGITKDGAGTLKLSGTNTHTGGTTVKAGTLAVTNVNALGSGDVTVNGGALDTTGVASGATFANGVAVGENGGTVTVANGTDLNGSYTSFSSLSGSGALTTNGWVQFNGTGGYNGHLTVNSGYTQINPNSVGVIDLTINSGAHFSLFNGGTLQIGKLNSTADVEFVGSQSGNAYTIEIGVGTTSSDTASFAGYIHCPTTNSKNITVKKVGAGTQTFNRGGYGYASPSGTIKEVIVDGGKMIINATHEVYTAGNTTGFWGNAPITVNSGGTLVYNHSWNTSPNVMLTVNGGTLTINSYEYQNKLTLNSATVNGSSELRAGYNGTGTWTVKGGTTTINNSVVTVKSGNYTTFTINIADGATLDLKKNITGLNKYTGTNLVVNGSGTNGTGTLKLHGATNIPTMTGLGTVKFNNINVEMTGSAGWLGNGFYNKSAVTLTNSTLTTSTPHTTNATVFTLDNSTLTFNGKINSYIHEITLKNGSKITGATSVSQFRTGHNWNSKIKTAYVSGTTENVMNTISADIVMHDPSKTMTFDIAAKAPLTFSGRFIPAAPDDYSSNHNNLLVKTGAGVLTLTGDNDLYQPVTISAGKLVLAGNGTLGTSDVTNNATLEFAYTSNKDFSNSISGTGVVIKSGSGTLTLTKVPGYTGATTVESGTLALSAGGTLYNLSGAGDVNYGANALTLSNSAATTFDGDILGSGAFTKTGTGTLTLSQQPEFTGSTTVESGTLALADGGTLYNLSGGSLDASGQIATAANLTVTGDLTLSNDQLSKFIGSIKADSIEKTGDGTLQIYCTAAGQVDPSSFVVSSGRLDMKEYFKGTLTVESGATLSPGNSVGTLTVDGDFNLNGGTLLMEVEGPTAAENDQLIVTNGNLILGEGATILLDFVNGMSPNAEFSVVIDAPNSTDDWVKYVDTSYVTGLSYTRTGEGNRWVLSGHVDANAVPEPSTWALLILGAAGLLYWRKRKSMKA